MISFKNHDSIVSFYVLIFFAVNLESEVLYIISRGIWAV
jgi:hypothetical protein